MSYLNISNGSKQLYALDSSNPTNMNMSSLPDDLRESKAVLTTALDQVTKMMTAFGVTDSTTTSSSGSSSSSGTGTTG